MSKTYQPKSLRNLSLTTISRMRTPLNLLPEEYSQRQNISTFKKELIRKKYDKNYIQFLYDLKTIIEDQKNFKPSRDGRLKLPFNIPKNFLPNNYDIAYVLYYECLIRSTDRKFKKYLSEQQDLNLSSVPFEFGIYLQKKVLEENNTSFISNYIDENTIKTLHNYPRYTLDVYRPINNIICDKILKEETILYPKFKEALKTNNSKELVKFRYFVNTLGKIAVLKDDLTTFLKIKDYYVDKYEDNYQLFETYEKELKQNLKNKLKSQLQSKVKSKRNSTKSKRSKLRANAESFVPASQRSKSSMSISN